MWIIKKSKTYEVWIKESKTHKVWIKESKTLKVWTKESMIHKVWSIKHPHSANICSPEDVRYWHKTSLKFLHLLRLIQKTRRIRARVFCLISTKCDNVSYTNKVKAKSQITTAASKGKSLKQSRKSTFNSSKCFPVLPGSAKKRKFDSKVLYSSEKDHPSTGENIVVVSSNFIQ